jgi:hypothetical protein
VSITVTVSGADRSLKFDWAAASGAWAAGVEPVALGQMRAHAPFRTGAMRQGIRSRLEPSPGRMWIVLYSTASYAPFVLGGTGAHVIEARNARALRWISHSGHGSAVFARRVNHPGTKPDDFPRRAIEPMKAMILHRFTEAVKGATFAE